jgi:hypothetical protein
MPSPLRKQPPLDLVEQFLKCVGLSSILDSSLFRKDFISLHEFESLLPSLESYYHPCKAIEFIHKPLTLTSAITILRQILKAHSASLILHEKTIQSSKTLWYSISIETSIPLSISSLTVSFD